MRALKSDVAALARAVYGSAAEVIARRDVRASTSHASTSQGTHLAWCLYECAALGEEVGVQIVPIGGVEVRLLVLRGTRVG